MDTHPDNHPPLDPEQCRQARLARDVRFDGEFFLAVKTTGIYCRPVCPARPPAERNVRYYRLASQAAQDGFRPCLRCRPETAPGSPAWRGSHTTVHRALALIEEGALDRASLATLAARLGVGERYLRKLFQRDLGIAPQAVAMNRRLLFAKQLLAETDLPMTEVADAAGFGSLRRFNSALREHFRLTPSQLRGRRRAGPAGAPVELLLRYRAPYDWAGVLAFFRHHQVDGIEAVDERSYQRWFSSGWLEVSHQPDKDALRLRVRLQAAQELLGIVSRVRRMFDLDANPAAIATTLGAQGGLASLLAGSPGARSPGHWSPFEAAVRAVVGQQVSTQAARNICARLARACSEGEQPMFPTPAALAVLDDTHFPMPGRRRQTLRDLCALADGREDSLRAEELAALAGIGPWTVAMVAIRGVGEPDVFPLGDLGLDKAWRALGHTTPLKVQAPAWSPWRSYAANLLWRSLG